MNVLNKSLTDGFFSVSGWENPDGGCKAFWDYHRRNSHGSSSQGGNGSEGCYLVGSHSFNCSQTDIALDP